MNTNDGCEHICLNNLELVSYLCKSLCLYYGLLRYDTMQSAMWLPTFWRNILLTYKDEAFCPKTPTIPNDVITHKTTI
jgi:hypothetical protein